jgi:hypothetical protein
MIQFTRRFVNESRGTSRPRDRFIEIESAFLVQRRGGDARDRFRQRRDSEDRIARNGQVSLEVAGSGGRQVNWLIRSEYRRDHAGQLAAADVFVEGRFKDQGRYYNNIIIL